MQKCAGIYLLQNYSTCFGCPSHPSSGVHKTVTAAYGTGNITYLSLKTTLEEGCCSDTWYYLHQKLQLQFYVLLMGSMDTRNM